MDRTVHARGTDGREVVRYGRAGKWWLEQPDGRRHPLQVPTAVSEAYYIELDGGQVFTGLAGGRMFDIGLRHLRAQHVQR